MGVELTITAHHWGWSEFRLCRQGGLGKDGKGVTQECFNNDVLRFDAAHAKAHYGGDKMKPGMTPWSEYVPTDPSDYIGTHPSVRCDGPGDDIATGQKLSHPEIWAPEGSCCNKGGDCGNSNSTKNQNVRWVFPRPSAATDSKYKVKIFLPAGLSCIQQQPCTMQWLFMTGNSPNSYPEAFRNCADFKLSSSATVEPEPQPELEPNTTTLVPPTVQTTTTLPLPATTTTATPVPTSTTTLAPTPSPISTSAAPSPSAEACVDTFSNQCSGCLASNKVCYSEAKSWCDQWSSYTWCGDERRLSPARSSNLRGGQN